MAEYWSATVSKLGDGAQEMFDAGVYILFAEPVPEELEEISVVHRGSSGTTDVQPGDQFHIGETVMTIQEVGAIANDNLEQLGHSVIYLNQPEQNLLPGAMLASGEQAPHPRVGQKLAFSREG